MMIRDFELEQEPAVRTKRFDAPMECAIGLTDHERRNATEDLPLRQLRGESIHTPPWVLDGSVRR